MSALRILSEPDVRAAVGLGTTELETIRSVFPVVSRRVGSMPPIQRIDVEEHNGEVDVKSAYLPGYDGIAVKISAGFFDNPKLGLPSLGGMVVVLDAHTGVPRAAIFDNGWLTDLRTALAGAVAADTLARADTHVAGIIGAGAQARLQLSALALVRPIERVVVWARDVEQATQLATSMAAQMGIPIDVADGPAVVCAEADAVVTTTPARTPLIAAQMLRPGLHITAVGSDAEHKQELDVEVVADADVVACDHREQSVRLGELRAPDVEGVDLTGVVELGEIIDGRATGRRDDGEVTLCDLTGTGAQDTAIASLAVERCVAEGLGTTFDI